MKKIVLFLIALTFITSTAFAEQVVLIFSDEHKAKVFNAVTHESQLCRQGEGNRACFTRIVNDRFESWVNNKVEDYELRQVTHTKVDTTAV